MYIVATTPRDPYTPEKIRDMLQAGANVLRLNLSHKSPEVAEEKIMMTRQLIEEAGLKGRVGIFADLPGNKIRLGRFEPAELQVRAGDRLLFKSSEASHDPREFVPVNLPAVGTYVEHGQVISTGDGEVGLEVLEIAADDAFQAKALNDGVLLVRNALNIGRALDNLDHVTPAARAHIERFRVTCPEWIGFSFVRSAEDIRNGRALVTPHLREGWHPKIVAKIESPMGIANIDEIAAAADIVMVARGDLGVTAPIELLGIYQKKIIKAAKRAGKEAVVSTHILESMLHYQVPQRAEVLDLMNIVLDGSDGIMFSKATSSTDTPGRAIRTGIEIIEAARTYLRERATIA